MIKHVHIVRKRLADGSIRWYVYAWRGGAQVASYDGRKRPKLNAKDAGAISAAVAKRSAPPADTLLSLIRTWRSQNPARPSSPEWDALAPNTKRTWGSALNKIEEKWGKVPLALFDDRRIRDKIIRWRDCRASTPRAADLGIDVLRALLEYGKKRGLLAHNFAAGTGKLYKGGNRAEIIWTADELVLFRETAVKLGKEDVADALEFAAVVGLRRDDLITVQHSGVRQFAIVKRAKKSSQGRRRFATIPRVPELDDVLALLETRFRQPGVETVLVTKAGLPWIGDKLTKEVAVVRKQAGIVHIDDETGRPRAKHLHDARGSYATKLMTGTDLNDKEIADIMAWSPEQVAHIRHVYVDDSARVVAIGKRIARGL